MRITDHRLDVEAGAAGKLQKVGLSLVEMRALWAHVLLLEGAQTDGWVRNSFIKLVSQEKAQ